jgi:hypothetical protein
MREADWSRAVVASLCTSKKAGWSFEQSWVIALKEFPAPRTRVVAEVQLSLVGDGAMDYEEETIAEFLKRVAQDAFDGERPALKHFSFGLVGDRDTTTFARVGRNRRAA